MRYARPANTQDEYGVEKTWMARVPGEGSRVGGRQGSYLSLVGLCRGLQQGAMRPSLASLAPAQALICQHTKGWGPKSQGSPSKLRISPLKPTEGTHRLGWRQYHVVL